MISAWWLLLIVPVAGSIGFAVGAIANVSSASDDCSDCMYGGGKNYDD